MGTWVVAAMLAMEFAWHGYAGAGAVNGIGQSSSWHG